MECKELEQQQNTSITSKVTLQLNVRTHDTYQLVIRQVKKKMHEV